MKTMKIKMLRLVLLLLFSVVVPTALTGCQDAAKTDSPAPAANPAPAVSPAPPASPAPPTNIVPPKL